MIVPGDCARILDVDGICASRTGNDNGLLVWQVAWCADRISEALDELRSRLGEGPGVRAVLRNAAVLVPDLASPSVQDRWPRYSKAALDLGVHAVFAFPLRRFSVPFGAAIAYRQRQGLLRSVDDAREFTEAAALVLAS